MNIQTIKTVDGQEFVLLPIDCYEDLKDQIDEYFAQDEDDEYVPFVLEKYVKSPVSLARINVGVTQTELAALMKVSQAYVSKLESSENVTPETMVKVNEALISRLNK
jgi:ribosome-binding protein aMBF1 (putative translation factor)